MANDFTGWLNSYYHENVEMKNGEAEAELQDIRPVVDNILRYVSEKDDRFGAEPIEAGSYSQRLKVSEDGDFDFVVEMIMMGSPKQHFCGRNLRQRHYRINNKPVTDPPVGMCFLHVDRSSVWNDSELVIDGDLIPTFVKTHLHELIEEAVGALTYEGYVALASKSHGPALVISVPERHGISVSVDLAPIAEYRMPFPSCIDWPRQNSMWPDPDKVRDILDIGINLVPKTDTHWVNSFSEAEDELINKIDKDGGNRKKVYKILKKINYREWSNTTRPEISSYDLKNVWFWTAENHPHEFEWAHCEMGARFLEMAGYLLHCIDNRHLPLYFDPRINLFDHKHDEEIQTCAKKIRNFLRLNVG